MTRHVTFKPGGLYIPHWILNDTNLTNSEAMVYAVIWHCSQGGNDYHGGLRYLCQCARVQTKNYLSTILRQLVKKGYLYKQTEKLLSNKHISHYLPVPVDFEAEDVTKNVTQVTKIATREIKKNNIYKENNIKERTRHDNRTNGQLAPNTQREDLLGQLL